MGKSTRRKGHHVSKGFDYESMIRDVAKMQIATQHIPAIVSEEIQKGWKQLPNTDASRSPKTWFVDPLALQYSLGYKDRRFSLTYDTLKRVSGQLAIVSSIINLRAAQVSAFAEPYRKTRSLGFVIKHKDTDHATTPAEIAFIKELEGFILNCGRAEKNPYSRVPRDDFDSFLRKIVRDSLTFDQACIEIVPDNIGYPFEFLAVDASTIRIASDDRYVGINSSYHSRSGFVPGSPSRFAGLYNEQGNYDGPKTADGESVDYVQVINGQIENIYSHSDLAFGVRNPRTDIYIQGYGYGELEQLITIVTAHLNAEEYNHNFFKQGSSPTGILNMKGDNWAPEELEAFKRQWTASVAGVENCLAGDTMLWTKEHGGSSIEKIVGNAEETPITIWTGSSWVSGLAYRTKEKKVLCHTTLANGVTVSTSPDHRFRVIGEDGLPAWKVQSNLDEGDFVLVNSKSVEQSDDIPTYEGKVITPDIAEVLGWAIGDGYLASNGDKKGQYFQLFYHHEKEIDLWDRHHEVLSEFVPSAKKIRKEISEEEIEKIKERYGFKSVAAVRLSIGVYKADFVRWLLSIGFQTSKDGKCIPHWLFTAPESLKASFLRGIFSADGCCANGRSPQLRCTSSLLRYQIRLLLLSMGVRTSLSEGKTKLVIDGKSRNKTSAKSFLLIKDRDLFFDKIGFSQDHKQPKELKDTNRANSYSRVDPRTVRMFLTKVREMHAENKCLSHRELMDLSAIRRGEDGCSLPRLLRFMEKANMPPPSWLVGHHFEHVVSTEQTTEEVSMFDVSVNTEEHEFVANGVVTHNSHKLPVINSEGVEFIDMGKTNQEMEFGNWIEYLIKATCGVFLVDPAELNFDMAGGVQQTPLFESSSEWKLKASRDRGLKPLLKFIAKLINRHIIDKIDDHFTLEFVGLDEMSEQEKHEMLVEQISSYLTLNEARKQLDLPPLEGGDVPMNPVFMQAQQLKQQEQQAQQEQEGGEEEMPPEGEEPPPEGEEEMAPQLPGSDPDMEDAGPQYAGAFGLPDVGGAGQ